MHLKTSNIRDVIKYFKRVEISLTKSDKETDNKFVKIEQNNEILIFCVYDIEKITSKVISELRENTALSTVGYEIYDDNEKTKYFPFKRLVISNITFFSKFNWMYLYFLIVVLCRNYQYGFVTSDGC